jgi:hypothetical protein
MRPVYNYGIPGWYTTVNWLNLQEAYRAGPLRYAVVFLGFQDFIESNSVLVKDETAHARLRFGADGAPNPARTKIMAEDWLLGLFSMTSVRDSIVTVMRQRNPAGQDLRRDGTGTDFDFEDAARTDGFHVLFEHKLALEAGRVDDAIHTARLTQYQPQHLQVVREIIDFARQKDIELYLVIDPAHKALLALYEDAGLGGLVSRWKTDLLALVRARGGGRVHLWDFNGTDRYSTEPVPAPGDRTTRTQWFWEPSHFQKALGHLMLARMFAGDPTPFGRDLTACASGDPACK